jgi:hypothetical protein
MPKNSIKMVQLRFGIFLCALLLIMAVPLTAFSQQTNPPPGEYITENGWGNLIIKSGTAGTAIFSIMSIGANAHTCTLDGEIRNGRAELEADQKDGKPCTVTFRQKGNDIEVAAATFEECRAYCGARAGFDGLYMKPVKGCDSISIKKSRAAFKRLYDKKVYAEAKAELKPVLDGCKKTLYWIEDGRIRNDLAITEYKLGNTAACRQILEPLADDAAKTDEDLRGNYPPADAESYMPVIKATRTNLRLCGAAEK